MPINLIKLSIKLCVMQVEKYAAGDNNYVILFVLARVKFGRKLTEVVMMYAIKLQKTRD